MSKHCQNCGKPVYNYLQNSTVTLGSSVWPYCQCPRIFTIHATITANTATVRYYMPVASPVQDEPAQEKIPQAFYDAFKDEELQP